jgi:3-oxocholest-4-en-26-oyl-CoA dehydrogenase beta subunit
VDFSFSEEQQAVSDLARQILEDQLGNEALRAHERSGQPFPAALWSALAEAGLLGISLPDDVGGSGLGFLEACLTLEQVGRTTAPIPFYGTVLAALVIDRFGSDEQRQALLPGVVAGATVLTVALTESGTGPLAPMTEASADGDGWRLSGSKLLVPFGEQAARIVAPARVGEGVAVFLVDPSGDGAAQEDLLTTSGLPETRLDLDGAAGELLGTTDRGAEVLSWLVERATAALCSTAVGVCEEALRLTAEYTKTREQFDRPIATFQAVGQRAADAYIDTEAVRLTAWQAAWRLSEGLAATEQVAIAKFWCAEGGQRVVHAAQHLHGGVGVDRDYPLHRYFLWAKQLELTLGGATQSLLGLGQILAAEPV